MAGRIAAEMNLQNPMTLQVGGMLRARLSACPSKMPTQPNVPWPMTHTPPPFKCINTRIPVIIPIGVY